MKKLGIDIGATHIGLVLIENNKIIEKNIYHIKSPLKYLIKF